MKMPRSLSDELIDRANELSPEGKDIVAALGHVPAISMVFHADLKTFWYSQQWYDYSGKTEAQMYDWAWGDFLPDADIPRVATGFYRSMESGTVWRDLYPLLGGDGQYRPHLCQAAPVHDKRGNVSFWVGNMTDIADMPGVVSFEKRLKTR
jgi:PAS domain-containing protein